MKAFGAAASAGTIVACCGVPALAASLFLPWYDPGGVPTFTGEPGGIGLRSLIVLLVIVVGLLAARSWWRRNRRERALARRLLLPVLSAGLLALVIVQLDGFARFWPVRPGGWLAAYGALGILLGALLSALGPTAGAQDDADGAAAGSRTAVRGTGCVVIVLLAAAGAFSGLASADIVAQSSTAAALPDLKTATPASPNHVRWSARLGLFEAVVGVSGRYVVVDQSDGVRVLDAETGQQRWYYLRRADDYTLAYTVLSPDGRTVYAIFDSPPTSGTVTVVALDTATGTLLREWSATTDTGDDERLFPESGDAAWYIVGNALVDVVHRTNSVIAEGFDAGTGSELWDRKWLTPGLSGSLFVPGCSPASLAPDASADGVLAVVVVCTNDENATVLQAVSETDGSVVWTKDISTNRDPSVIPLPGSGFLVVNEGTNTGVLLSAGTGRTLGSFGSGSSLYGGDPVLSLGFAQSGLTVAGLDPGSGRTRWTATAPSPFATADPQSEDFETAECSGRAYILGDDAGDVRLYSLGDAAGQAGRAAATTAQPQLAGLDPDFMACAPGALLVQSSSFDDADLAAGEVLVALD